MVIENYIRFMTYTKKKYAFWQDIQIPQPCFLFHQMAHISSQTIIHDVCPFYTSPNKFIVA